MKPWPDLLPCPFCGEKRIFLNEPSEYYRRGSINCPACLVVMSGEVNQNELINSWNARSDQTVEVLDARCAEFERRCHEAEARLAEIVGSEMVERVAKAIRGRRIDLSGHIQANPLDPENAFEMALARAAIAAMRQPTEPMRIAGITNNFGKYADASWEAMIDEALKKGEGHE